MMHVIPAIAALLLLLGLSGCGQSGPLYLPGDPSEVRTPPAETASDEEEDETGDDGRQ